MILCHIVGINNLIKDSFIRTVESYNISIIDLDMITNEIRDNNKLKSMYRNYDKTKNKNILKDIRLYWKTQFQDKLDEQLTQHEHVILIGLSTYHRNNRVHINIDTNNKFFLKIDSHINAENIVQYNIDKYKDHIINGTFPLKYIDHHFLMKQRETLLNIYQRMNYKLKTIDAIKAWIVHNIKTNMEHSNIYIATKSKNIIRSNSIGYHDKWLALLMIIDNFPKYFKKGYINKKNSIVPYVMEKRKDAFDLLQVPCFLHTINSKYFNKLNHYKYETNNIKSIDKTIRIKNVYDFLIDLKVMLIKYKEL